MKKLVLTGLMFLILLSANAYADSFYLLGGYVTPKGESDVFEQNEFETDFEVNDLNGFGGSIGYDHFLGNYVNVGGGVSFYEANQDVFDEEFEFQDGRPVGRNLALEIIPVEFNIRFLPAGRDMQVIPYVGGGPGIYVWSYEEVGDFIINRNTQPQVITGQALSDGANFGFHVEAGVQVPVTRSAAITAEYKYWKAEGDLDPEGFDPSFEPLDLSGTMISGGVSFWF